MTDENRRMFKGMLFFFLMGVMLFMFIYPAYRGPWDPDLRKRWEEIRARYDPVQASDADDGKVRFSIDKPLTMGNTRLVFQGVENERIHFTVYILDLDPQVGYHYQFTIEKARQGIHLGDHDFFLISHSENDLVLGLGENFGYP